MKRSLNILRLQPFLSILLFASLVIGIITFSQKTRIERAFQYHLGIEHLDELLEIRVRLIPRTQNVYFEGDGVKLAGTIFINDNETAPGIIFLHGSSIKGRKIAFGMLLCEQLSENGYHVLSFDMRGFGESDNPNIIDAVESWNSRMDVSLAINFLIENSNVDTNAIYIVGHSAGANQAIIAGIHDARIKKIVAIGPSRRVQERVINNQSNERESFIERFSRDRNLDDLVSQKTYLQISTNTMIDTYLDYFQTEGHMPILLVDGGREDEQDLNFLRSISHQMISPQNYITIKNSNHYCNVKAIGPIIFYNHQVFNALVDSITQWLKT